jgi:hypothetical protein
MKMKLLPEDQRELPADLQREEMETDLAWREAYASLILIAGEETVSAASQHFESIGDLAANAFQGIWVSEDHSVHRTNGKLRKAMRAEILWLD